jgi:hypothetical protein
MYIRTIVLRQFAFDGKRRHGFAAIACVERQPEAKPTRTFGLNAK